jgi:hypothetical protein
MTGGEASRLAARRSAPVPGGHFGRLQMGNRSGRSWRRDHGDPGPTGRRRHRRICIVRHFDTTVTYAQFTLPRDEPVSLLGIDTAVSLGEYILKALPLKHVALTLGFDIELSGFLRIYDLESRASQHAGGQDLPRGWVGDPGATSRLT